MLGRVDGHARERYRTAAADRDHVHLRHIQRVQGAPPPVRVGVVGGVEQPRLDGDGGARQGLHEGCLEVGQGDFDIERDIVAARHQFQHLHSLLRFIIEHLAELDAAAVKSEAAHFVGGGGLAFGRHRRVGECQLALRRAEGLGVVAVVKRATVVAAEGGSVGDVGLVWGQGDIGGGGVEAVDESAGAVAPAYEAAAEGGAVGGEQPSVEDAAADGERAVVDCHDAAMRAVAALAAVDDDAAAAVADADGAPLAAGEAAGEFIGGVDVAVHMEAVDDGAVLEVAEGCGVFLSEGALGSAVGDGQRVALAVEGAHEVVVVAARHARDADVGGQPNRLADETVVGGVVLQGIAEIIPFRGVVDDVFRHRVDDDIGIGHGEGINPVGEGDFRCRAAFGGVGGDDGEAFGDREGEVEAHLVSVAGVKRTVIHDARAVAGDAADVIFGGITGHLHEDTFDRGDAVGLLALRRAKRLGVVAVVKCAAVVAAEGGSGVDAGLAWAQGNLGGGIEAVADGDGAVVIAYEAGTKGGAVGGEQTAVEDAAIDGERVVVDCHDATVGAVALFAAVDDDTAAAVADADGAILAAGDAAGEFVGGVDVSVHMEAVDVGAVLEVAEGRGVFLSDGVFGSAVGNGQRVDLAVEGTHEVVVVAARHAGDGDVGGEFHGLADETVVGVVVLQGVAEIIPFRGVVDEVFRHHIDDNIGVGHGEGIDPVDRGEFRCRSAFGGIGGGDGEAFGNREGETHLVAVAGVKS